MHMTHDFVSVLFVREKPGAYLSQETAGANFKNKNGGVSRFHKRLNTGMAPTCDWMIKIVKVNKLYLNSLLVSIVNRVSQSGTMKYQCE